MTQEEIIKLANTAGFNWSDIQATTIEQRLERFASLVAATEREKFTNTQEFVTLPREVVEQAIAALTDLAGWRAAPLCDLLRAALEQPQNHVPDAGNMVPAGWKLVPVEPTVEMLRAGCGSESPAMFRESLRRETDGQKTVEMVEKIIQRNLNSYRAMLDAAPQPPALEQQVEQESTCKDSLQVEQEPVAWMFHAGDIWKFRWHHFNRPMGDDALKYWKPIFTHPQARREPLTHYEIHELFRRSWDDCQDGDEIKAFARAIEAAHGIK